MLQLAIIADDLTGALDTGIKFSKMGIRTQVMVGHKFCVDELDLTKEVLVVDTETRHVPENEAYARVYKTVKLCTDCNIPCFYKKTDSALRGHIGSEFAALYDVVGKQISFVPALPGENRITREGIHYIKGVPVSESIFGSDPLNPVRNSSVGKLIEEETRLSTKSVRAKELTSQPWPEDQVLIFDASTGDDMEEIAGLLKREGHLDVTAGCAGFAEILSSNIPFEREDVRQAPKTDKLFVISGSINAVTKKQVEYARQQGYVSISLTQEEKLAGDYLKTREGTDFLKKLEACCRENDRIILDVFSEDTIGDARAYAAASGFSPEEIPERIAKRLGELSQFIVELKEDATLMIIGGDTLYSFMQKLKKPILDPVCEPVNGTVSMYVQSDGHNFPLISKSGGFGQEDLIIETSHYVMKNGGIQNEEELS